MDFSIVIIIILFSDLEMSKLIGTTNQIVAEMGHSNCKSVDRTGRQKQS